MLIATHSGSFHADDVVGVALATVLYPGAQVIRTRDPGLLAQASLRLDVGGVANPATGDFDHHFPNPPVRANGSRYSGAGLFWHTHGPAVLRKIFPGLRADEAERRAEIVDRMFFEGMDRIDNGQEVADPADRIVSATLGRYNLTWNERPDMLSDVEGAITGHFTLAVTRLRPILVRLLGRIARSTSPIEARTHVAEARRDLVAASMDREAAEHAAVAAARPVLADILRQVPQGPPDTMGVLVLDNPSLPWADLLHELEAETGRRVSHVIKQETSGAWVATAVPTDRRAFASRVLFPALWAGLRGEALVTATGMPDAIFCHPGRWISGWRTLEAAQRAVELARAEGAGGA